MNRREFAGLAAAGAIFPTELVKGAVSEEKPKIFKAVETANVFQLGEMGRDGPWATQSQVDEYYRQMKMAVSCVPLPFPRVPYGRWFGPAKDLVVAFGPESSGVAGMMMSASQWGRLSLRFAAGWPIVTEYPVEPFYLPPGTIDTPIFIYRSDMEEIPMTCGTIISGLPGGKEYGSVMGHRRSFAGHKLTWGGSLKYEQA